MAYGGSPSSTNRDGVRLAVGDISTSTASEYLANADYDFVLTLASDYASRVVIAARMIGGKFANGGLSKKVGDLAIDKGDRVAYYKNLAAQWEAAALAGVAPYLGGRSISDKDAALDDTDRVGTSFRIGQCDYPSAKTAVTT